MAIYREISGKNSERQKAAYSALAIIICLMAYEGYNAFVLHKPSFMGICYNFVLLGLWLWRCEASYTYTLKGAEFIVEKRSWGKTKTTTIDLTGAFCFNPEYKSSIFRRTKVNRFQHRYSSVDGNKQRLLVYRHGTHLWGMIFKTGDKFSDQLFKALPPECLQGNI